MLAAGLSGCAEARYISQSPTTKTIAVPMDGWIPADYRAEAVRFAKENDPTFKEADILHEGEVSVGKQTETGEVEDRRPRDQNGKPIGELTTRSSVTTTTDLKEYHLEYRVASKVIGNTKPMGSGVMQTGGTMKPTEMKPNEMKPTGRVTTTPTTPMSGPSLSTQPMMNAPTGNFGPAMR